MADWRTTTITYKGIQLGIEMIGPDEARRYLDESAGPGNRTVAVFRVISYLTHILAGRWGVVSEPIVFGLDDRMANGRHRMEAVVKSGRRTAFLVARNVSEEECQHIDGNRVRTLPDRFKMYRPEMTNRVTRAATVTACATLAAGRGVLVLDFGDYDMWYRVVGKGVDWALSLGVGSGRSGLKIMRTSAVLGSLAFAYKTNPDAVTDFGMKLVTGANIKSDDPVLAMRRWLEGLQSSRVSVSVSGNNRPAIARRVLNTVRATIQGEAMRKVVDSDEGVAYFRKCYYDIPEVCDLIRRLVAAATSQERLGIKEAALAAVRSMNGKATIAKISPLVGAAVKHNVSRDEVEWAVDTLESEGHVGVDARGRIVARADDDTELWL